MSFHELRNQTIVHIRHVGRLLYFEYPSRQVSPEETAHRKLLLDCQRAWYRALQQFEDKHLQPEADNIAIAAMKMQLHILSISTDCSATILQTPYDAHLEVFKEILRLAKIVLDFMDLSPPRPSARFTFEISLIPSIYLAGTRCRCPVTRREALALLKRHPPREGMWDAESHVIVVCNLFASLSIKCDQYSWAFDHPSTVTLGKHSEEACNFLLISAIQVLR
jgi:hypothetical protein